MRDSQRKIKKSVVFDENRNETKFFDKSDPSSKPDGPREDLFKHPSPKNKERIIDISDRSPSPKKDKETIESKRQLLQNPNESDSL